MFEISVNLISADGNKEVIIFVGIEQEQEHKAPKKVKEEPELSLPKAIRVLKDKSTSDDEEIYTWNDCSMTAADVVKIDIDENNVIEAIKINMDSNLIKKKINSKGESVADIRNRYIANIYGHSLMLYSTLLSYYSNDNNASDLTKDQLNVLKDDLNTTLEFVFQVYGGFLMDFDSTVMQADV